METTLPDLTNRSSAKETRNLLVERVFRWNQMRRTQICYNAVPSSKQGKDIIPDEDKTVELENEILDAFKWWIVDDLYWYIRECVESMGIGVHVEVDFFESKTLQDVIKRENGALHIHITNNMVMLAHTPAICQVSSVCRAREFFMEIADLIYSYLRKDGYEMTRYSSSRHQVVVTDDSLNSMKEQGRVRFAVTWADLEFADLIDGLEYESQLAAVMAGVPVEDVLA